MSKSRATTSAVDTPDPTDGPGHRLAAERQARGIEIDRVAALLHLRRTMVEALEGDCYDQLPDPVFVAGYLRNYARLLGIDGDPIVDAYKSRVVGFEPTLAAVPPASPGEPTPKPGGGLLVRAAAVAVFGAAVALLALWWQGQGPDLGGSPSATQTSAAGGDQTTSTTGNGGTGSADAPADPVTVDKTTAAADVQPTAAPPAQAAPTPPVAATATPAATPPETGATDADEDFGSAATAATPAAAGQVELEFTGASWIDVRGADGKLVLNGEMRAGDRRVLSGRPPFKLVIGNTAATRMTVDGQPFDLQSRSRGNVARFTLDPSAPR